MLLPLQDFALSWGSNNSFPPAIGAVSESYPSIVRHGAVRGYTVVLFQIPPLPFLCFISFVCDKHAPPHPTHPALPVHHSQLSQMGFPGTDAEMEFGVQDVY